MVTVETIKDAALTGKIICMYCIQLRNSSSFGTAKKAFEALFRLDNLTLSMHWWPSLSITSWLHIHRLSHARIGDLPAVAISQWIKRSSRLRRTVQIGRGHGKRWKTFKAVRFCAGKVCVIAWKRFHGWHRIRKGRDFVWAKRVRFVSSQKFHCRGSTIISLCVALPIVSRAVGTCRLTARRGRSLGT